LMLVVGSLNTADFTRGDFTNTVENSWAWSLLLLALAFVGTLNQTRQRVVLRRTIHDTWYAESP